MGTALIYLVVLLVVAAVFFAGASAVFGRGEELAPVPPGATPTWLPDRAVRASHVRAVRFQQALRGYKMAEVDWVLDRLAGELDRHSSESESLRRRIAELESAVAGAKQADVVSLVAGETEIDAPGNGAGRVPGVERVHGGAPGPEPESESVPASVERDRDVRTRADTGTDRHIANEPPKDPRPIDPRPAEPRPAEPRPAQHDSQRGAEEPRSS
jgi:DivIVA domain-containing protein